MLSSLILAAARNGTVKKAVAGAPISRNVVRRFVAGESAEEVLVACARLVGQGLQVSLDHLGEDTNDAVQARTVAQAYAALLERLAAEGLTPQAEVSVKLSAVGQLIDEKMALGLAQEIGEAAVQAGTTVTLDMEDHTTTDSTLEILGELRRDFPATGAVLQAYLRRTEADCRDLAHSGSRVRLCKGAYAEPETVAFQEAAEVDKSYVRCINLLMAGEGYPMFATHDPRLVGIAGERAAWFGRPKQTWEYQMLYGIRPEEQLRLASAGHTVRVYVPYGVEWFGYLMRRLAERPANVTFFLRALASRN
ncbi:MAG: proline dehydrogenase family protein [Geodermatophilaceae bacterium]